MSFNVIATSAFLKQAKKLSKKHTSLRNDLLSVIGELEFNPVQGIPLGKNCYKIRIAITSKGKGKSGGGRMITCIKIVAKLVFLIAIYDKSERENIDDSELDSLLKQAGLL